MNILDLSKSKMSVLFLKVHFFKSLCKSLRFSIEPLLLFIFFTVLYLPVQYGQKKRSRDKKYDRKNGAKNAASA